MENHLKVKLTGSNLR